MVKKITKYLKFVVCCALIMSLIAPSYAALSASDGSAFVTKAEFDSALADFNARLTTFEAGINSKIDSQVTSYLDRNGIWNGAKQTFMSSGKPAGRLLTCGSNTSNLGHFFNSYTDKWLAYYLYKNVFHGGERGVAKFLPLKICNNITKSGLMFCEHKLESRDAGGREGLTVVFPYMSWETGVNTYAILALTRPGISLNFVISEEALGTTEETCSFNEKVKIECLRSDWSVAFTDGISRVPGYSGYKSYTQFKNAPTGWYDPDLLPEAFNTTAENREIYGNKLGTDWIIDNFSNCPTLGVQADISNKMVNFFVSKDKELWCYWEIQWVWCSSRAYQSWSPASDYAIVYGINDGKTPYHVLSGSVY